jgi:hypothetical protein
MVASAIQHHSSFNLIHMPTMMKVDVFIPKGQAYDRLVFERAQEKAFDEVSGAKASPARLFLLASPEDVILRKLQWFQMGGGISERQWNDVLGVLKVQSAVLDYEYMRNWASQLGLSDLLERAIKEAGLSK